MRTMIKRAGLAATLFFLIKGLVWLALFAGAAAWTSGARAASTAPRPHDGSLQAAAERGSDHDEAWAQKIPMGLGRTARKLKAAAAFGVDGEQQATIGVTSLAVIAMTASVVAMRVHQFRESRAGNIVSISLSTAGRTARAASFRPCV